jgi:surface polysaccharide O-acyltransferase-like enzyme
MGLFVTGITLSNIAGEAWDVVWNGYDTIFTFINVCIIFALCLSYKGNNKVIELVSKNTLGIYFVHEIFVHLTIKYIKAIPVFQNFVGSIIYALAIMFICTAVIQILNKIPLFRKLVKL